MSDTRTWEIPESDPARNDRGLESTGQLGWFIACIGLFTGATAGSFTLLPLAGQAQGLGLAPIGILVALPGLAQVLGVLPAGTLSDRHGRRRLMLLALACIAISDLCLAFGSPIGLAIGAAGIGLSGACFFPAMLAYSTEVRVRPQTWVQGLNGSIQGFGALVGATTAAIAAGVGGFSAGFGTCLLLAVGGAGTVLLLSPAPERGRHVDATVTTVFRRSWAVLRHRPLVGQAVLASVPQVIAIAVIGFSFFPLMVADEGISLATIGVLVGVRSVMLALVGLLLPILVPRIGLRRVMLIPQAVGAVTLAFAPIIGTVLGLVAFSLVQGAAFGMVSGASNMMVARGTSSSERAVALASQDLIFGLATLVTPLVLASIGVIGGTEALFVAGSISCLAALAAYRTWSARTPEAAVGM